MRQTISFLLLLILLSCAKENKKQKMTENKKSVEKDALCSSEEERAKYEIQSGNLIYIVSLPLSTNYRKADEIQKELEKENIHVDFKLNSCLVQKGIQNCYEVYMNTEFEKINGKSVVNKILLKFEESNLKTMKIEKQSLHDRLYKKTAYNSGLAQ